MHPTKAVQELVGDQLIYSSEPRGWRGITVERQIQAPNEFDSPLLAAHLLIHQLHDTSHQVTRIGDSHYEGAVQKGETILLPAGMPSFFAWNSYDDAIMLIIEPSFLRQIALETCEMNPERVELLPQPLIYDSKLEHIALLFDLELINEGEIGSPLYAESLTQLLAVHLLHNHCTFAPPPRKPNNGLETHLLRLVIDCINDQLEQNLSLTDLATTVNLSPYHFARQFKQATGYAPHEYVIKQRIERAKHLLLQGNLTIAEIATTVGFFDHSHLARHFKRFYGVTPQEFLRK